jgi:hypothetical protein
MSERTWDDVLDDGEEILWHGRPATSLHLKGVLQVILGPLLLAIFATVFFREQFANFLGDLGESFATMDFNDLLIYLLVGGFIVSVLLFKGAAALWERAQVWYTLTNRRAFIVTSKFLRGKRMQQYWLSPDLPIIIDNTDSPPSVIFDTKRAWRGANENTARSVGVSVGFKRIEDAERVSEIMKDCQANWTDRDPG